MAAAIQLKKQLDITAEIFEATEDIGGTWHYNTYPGCACDIPSHLYSFSFELNPNWSKKYSDQKEIHDYMRYVAKKYGIYEQTELSTKVIRASWIEGEKKWELELQRQNAKDKLTDKNQIKYFNFVFSSIGGLRIPVIPEQFKSFTGKIIHSAFWDNNYDFTDKRVAVIGSGASAVQIIPNLAAEVKHLYSFQRTPSWVGPRYQTKHSKLLKMLFRYFPFIMRLYRACLFFYRDFRFKAWGDANSWLARAFKSNLRKHMLHLFETHGRPDLAEKLIPDFPVGCKRILISDDYCQTLCAPNVTVITSNITGVEDNEISTLDGAKAEVDVLVLATGFDTIRIFGQFQVYGRNGLHLNELWDNETPKTFKTVTVHGLPNYFFLLGPGSALGHNSVVVMIESQVEFAVKMIRYMIKNKFESLEPKEKSQEAYSSDVQRRFKGTVWTGGCSSWYINEHGNVQSLWPGSVMSFIKMLKTTDYKADYSEA
ncbi:monooxygenase [Mycotypha africana]|uniref:monooxygenase n=1 Tax=Mycotypha africana TaxID=64632 RepID=UPI0023005841|nr:monooxygenase [Mycotypha africana]KAI8991772.1 monooxygenase [Mycotypha africana]